MTKRVDSSTESWQSIADDWVHHADTNDYRNEFIMPRTFRLLGDVRSRCVLDLGCGEGGYSRELAKLGADVTGVDGSERLIEIAGERSTGLKIKFQCANAAHMPMVASSRFDWVLASMSLMDVEDYPGTIAEVHRVLKSGGKLLMSITHPCFTGPVSKWIKDDSGGVRYFAVDRYFERRAWDDYMAREFRKPVLRRHRPLEDYMSPPIGLGFRLVDFHEPIASGEDLQKSRRFWKLQRIPYFLFMVWMKL